MKPKHCILNIALICVLLLTSCVPLLTVPVTQTPAPTATIVSSPTPRPERNVALYKAVRVSASWVVDPPERAVDGDLDNWWGAGGPAPQWIEVDLQGLYSISRIKVINQGPTGNAAYQVFGRGLDDRNQLLHTFEGNKSENQTLEYSPETPWKDISTIRIEINSGSGWVGLREIQVFSREEPKRIPALAGETTPLYLAGVDVNKLKTITRENASVLKPLSILGRGPVNQMVWSPDGSVLAVASPLGIWLYDSASLKSPPRLLQGHTRDVLSVAFSPDGRTVYSGSQDGTVKQWNAETGHLKRTIALWNDFSYEVGEQKREKEVWSIAFSPDATKLAAGTFNGSLRLWDLDTEKVVTNFSGHKHQISHLAFSPDGSLLASNAVDGSLFVWDVVAGSQKQNLSNQGQVQTLAFSPDGHTLAYGGFSMNTQLWDASTGEQIGEVAQLKNVISLAFVPDGSSLVSSNAKGVLQSWDIESRRSSVFNDKTGWITNIAVSPDGSTLAVALWSGVLQLWDVATHTQSDVLASHTNPVNSIAFSPDGMTVASGGEDGIVWLWDIEKNSPYGALLAHQGSVTGVAFSPDGKLIASGGFDHMIRLWNARTFELVFTLSGHTSYARSVAFSPDGKTVASGGRDQTVRLWDVATGKELATLDGHTGEVENVSFSPDGKWVLSASADKTLRIWDVATQKEADILKGHLSFALSAAISPNSTMLVSGGGDHYVRLWNLEMLSGVPTGRMRYPEIGHGGWVLAVTFSPNGELIASANVSTTSYWVAPGEIHLYGSEKGDPYGLLRGHTKRVTSLAFSPDGKLLASGSADGSVRLWGVTTDNLNSETGQNIQPTMPAAPTTTPLVTQSQSVLWVATYTYDPGVWIEGMHSYHFEGKWNGGSEITPVVQFKVSKAAPAYEGYVLLRGLALRAHLGGECPTIDSPIRTDQKTLFHNGYVTDSRMSYEEAVSYFDNLSANVIWDDGKSAELVRQEIIPYSENTWLTHYCSKTQ